MKHITLIHHISNITCNIQVNYVSLHNSTVFVCLKAANNARLRLSPDTLTIGNQTRRNRSIKSSGASRSQSEFASASTQTPNTNYQDATLSDNRHAKNKESVEDIKARQGGSGSKRNPTIVYQLCNENEYTGTVR